MINKKGFTIIELIVATGLFVVVIASAAGIFVNSLRTQRALVSLMAANDNASLALEQMSREIRIGSRFAVNGQRTELNFSSQRAGEVVYRLNSESATIERNGVAITGKNVKVSYLFFDLRGEEIGDGASTRVTIRIGITASDKKTGDIITSLQTTVSSRQLDI